MDFQQNTIRPRPISVLLAMPELGPGVTCRNELVARNCIVHLVHDGSEVAEALTRFRPDVILLDAAFAAADRNAVLTGLSRRSPNNAIPVIMLSGDGGPPDWGARLRSNAVVPQHSSGALLYRTIVACLSTAACAA